MANPQLMTGLGAVASMFLSSLGASVASAQSGVFALRCNGKIQAFIPIIISGVLAIYGSIVSVLLANKLGQEKSGENGMESAISELEGYRYLCSGLVVGLACLASGLGMSKFMESTMLHFSNGTLMAPPSTNHDGEAEQPLIATNVPTRVQGAGFSLRMMFVLVFLEAIGLYGLIVALLLIH